MGMSRCYSLMKCLLIIFSIIFLVVGCGVVAFAVWALYDGAAGGSAAGHVGLCALGAWALVLAGGAACGVWGAARGAASMLAAAFALLALSLVAEGAAAWWGAAHLPALRAALGDALARSVAEDYGAVAARSHALDAIQRGLRCCGAEGPRDWQRAAWAGGAGAAGALDLSVSAPAAHYWVPASCCVSADETECAVARRVAVGGAAPGVWEAGCAARAAAALAAAARAPLLAGAALLAAHAAALLLALALTLRAHPHPHKA